MGEMRRRISQLVYQAEETPSSIYASHGTLKSPEQLQRGRGRGQRESSCLTVIILS